MDAQQPACVQCLIDVYNIWHTQGSQKVLLTKDDQPMLSKISAFKKDQVHMGIPGPRASEEAMFYDTYGALP